MRLRRATLIDRLTPRCAGLDGDLTETLRNDCDADTAARETQRLINFLALVDIAAEWDRAEHA